MLPLRQGARNGRRGAQHPGATEARLPRHRGVRLNLPPAGAFARAERAARAMGWPIVAVAPEALRIEATDTTLCFGFKGSICELSVCVCRVDEL